MATKEAIIKLSTWYPLKTYSCWKKSCTSCELLVTMKQCKKLDYNGINHLPTGVGFLPSTVAFTATMINIYIYTCIKINPKGGADLKKNATGLSLICY